MIQVKAGYYEKVLEKQKEFLELQSMIEKNRIAQSNKLIKRLY